MNPYHAIAVAQHNRSLILVARSANARRAEAIDYGTGPVERLRDAAASAWSLAATAPAILSRLRGYPTGSNA